MRAGVTVVDPATTWVDVDVRARPGRTLLPDTQLRGATVVGDGAEIGPDTTLSRRRGRRGRDGGAHATAARRRSAPARPSARSPTCAPARGSARRARSARSSRRRTPRSARAQGAAPVLHRRRRRSARQSNIGAASVFVNYDGVTSTARSSASHCRTGSDNMFVAPVTVGDGAYTGAGTVLRHDVPPGALAVSAGPQRNIEGWVEQAGRARRGEAAGTLPLASRRVRHRTRRRPSVDPAMSAMTATEKNLMLFGGRAHPELAEEVAKHLDVDAHPAAAYDFANGEIFVRFEESVRGCDAFVIQSHTRADQRVAHGAADHGRRAQARVGQAHHRGHAVLPVRPPGQEAPRPRADLRAPGGRPVQDRGRRPADDRRPAHRPDPGLLRRPGRPPVRDAAARRARRQQVRGPRARPSSRPTPAASKLAESWADTLGGTPLAFIHKTRDPAGPTRSSPTGWSARSRAGSAS